MLYTIVGYDDDPVAYVESTDGIKVDSIQEVSNDRVDKAMAEYARKLVSEGATVPALVRVGGIYGDVVKGKIARTGQ